MRRLVVSTFVIVSACGSRHENAPVAPLEIRLTTAGSLAPMIPVPLDSFTRNLADLVYESLSVRFDRVEQDGSTVRLHAKPGTNLDDAAKAFRHPDLVEVRVVPGGLDLVMSSPEAAMTALQTSTLLPALGAYVVESFEENKELRLARREAGEGPARIIVRTVERGDEEWRQLLGHHSDVVPTLSPAQMAQLKAVPSIRLLRVENPSTVALFFNTTRLPEGVRRSIALALRRRAIAKVVLGDERYAFDGEREDAAEARRLWMASKVEASIEITVPSAMPDLERTALVIKQQLASVGIASRIVPVNNSELRQVFGGRGFDVIVFYGGVTSRYIQRGMLSCGYIGNATGFCDARFDQAVAAGDLDTAIQIARDAVPIATLYRQNEGAALDASLCAPQPKTGDDFSWLAFVHRCRSDELR